MGCKEWAEKSSSSDIGVASLYKLELYTYTKFDIGKLPAKEWIDGLWFLWRYVKVKTSKIF